jgi:hypothetical protein
MRRKLSTALILVGVLGAGIGAFLLARSVLPATTVTASRGHQFKTEEDVFATNKELWRMYDEDANQPKFTGKFNGVKFKTDVGASDLGCTGELQDATPQAIVSLADVK